LLSVDPLREVMKLAPVPGASVPPIAHFRPRSLEVLVSRCPGSLERWEYDPRSLRRGGTW